MSGCVLQLMKDDIAGPGRIVASGYSGAESYLFACLIIVAYSSSGIIMGVTLNPISKAKSLILRIEVVKAVVDMPADILTIKE